MKILAKLRLADATPPTPAKLSHQLISNDNWVLRIDIVDDVPASFSSENHNRNIMELFRYKYLFNNFLPIRASCADIFQTLFLITFVKHLLKLTYFVQSNIPI